MASRIPTLFAYNGEIMKYDGAVMSLKASMDDAQWREIVRETIKYKLYLQCLKEIACPSLEDDSLSWSSDDDKYIQQLDATISKMSNIDPLLVSSIDQAAISNDYSILARRNLTILKQQIVQLKVGL